MCLLVFTEIPEALTFTPFSLSLEYGEGAVAMETVEHARFLCFVDGVGDRFYSINSTCDHGNEQSETL